MGWGLGIQWNVIAGDWPQPLGPSRNGIAQDEQLPDRLPTQPKIVWRQAVGLGYAGPSIAAGKVFLFDRMGEQERLTAFDLQSGEMHWQQAFAATYRGGVDPDNGPRCVPVFHGDAVVVLGAGGGLHCVNTADGKRRWSRDLMREFNAKEGYFGFGSTPVVWKDLVLVNVGGSPDAGIVAFDLGDGSMRWKATGDDASYSAPSLITSSGKPADALAAFVTRLHLRVLDPADGKVIYQRPFGQRGPTVNAAAPLVLEEGLFLTASYGIGAMLIDWRGKDSKVVWENDTSLSSQYNTPVSLDGHLYGIHGREDAGLAELRCIETRTGRVAWSVPGFGVAHLIRAEKRLLALKVDGTMLVCDLSPTKYLGPTSDEATCRVSQGTTRALPALSEGHLLVRDHQGEGGSLYCISLR